MIVASMADAIEKTTAPRARPEPYLSAINQEELAKR